MDDRPHAERREHPRFRLHPMYTSVTAQPQSATGAGLEGHAYDISESGVRIELDEPLGIGQTVALRLNLPGGDSQIQAKADVMWVNDGQDDPGPRRMALRFTQFKSSADQQRLAAFLGHGLQRLAA